MSKPEYTVVDDVFHYTAKSGKKLAIDFDLPPDVLKVALEGDKDDQEQFDAVAAWLGDDARETYDGMGALERLRFVRTFFDEFQKAAMMPLGESQGSSTS